MIKQAGVVVGVLPRTSTVICLTSTSGEVKLFLQNERILSIDTSRLDSDSTEANLDFDNGFPGSCYLHNRAC